MLRFEENVIYGHAGGHPLYLDILTPPPPDHGQLPTVIYVHGGGWIGGDKAWTPNLTLANDGFFTVSIAYRYSPEAPHPAQIHDVKAAIRWVRARAAAYGADPDHIGIWGASAGGHLSALCAVTNHDDRYDGESGTPGVSSAITCAVPICPPTELLIDWYAVSRIPMHPEALVDIGGLLGAMPWDRPDLARAASPHWQIGPHAAPQLIIHGERDDLVPIAQARAYLAALHHAGHTDTDLIAVPDADHGVDAHLYDSAPDPHNIKPRVIAFFRAHLQPGADT